MPTWLPWAKLAMLVLCILLLLGIGFKVFEPKSKTTVQAGGVGVINNCEKEIPLLGCSIHKFKLKAVWQ
jgi:hypothetical protein